MSAIARIGIVEDDTRIREALFAILSSATDMVLEGSFANA